MHSAACKVERKLRFKFHEVELILQGGEKKEEEEEETGRMSFQLEPSESLISYPICNTVEALVSVHLRDEKKGSVIDLFTDTAAILNLLDLRSIMGCPGGH